LIDSFSSLLHKDTERIWSCSFIQLKVNGLAIVFQYGSNTSPDRLNSEDRLCGDAKSLGLAYILGQYHLGFTVYSHKNGCAAADLIRAPGKRAWGVLYEIPDYLLSRDTSGERKSMEDIEGPNYRRRRINVIRADEDGDLLDAWTYTVRPEKREKGLRTSLEYVNHILTGLKENQAPEEYIEEVKARILKNNPDLKDRI